VCGNAQQTIGFDKNPLSIFYSKRKKHIISTFQGIHETERNQNLIAEFTDDKAAKPVIYVSKETEVSIQDLVVEDYIVIAPASVWFTKQFPAEKWISFISKLDERFVVYLIGAKSDRIYCGRLIAEISLRNPVLRIKNISGDLSIKQSAALMKKARMNYVNDSAPLHIASAVNSPITAIFCSTVPSFGFGPLSDRQHIIEIRKELYCRPCGLHGYKSCPEKHFRCAYEINVDELLHTLDDTIQ
jgi:heptosyltransferase-2